MTISPSDTAPGLVIAIDGPCNAGKTTLIHQLAATLLAATVPEQPAFNGMLFLDPAIEGASERNETMAIFTDQCRIDLAASLARLGRHVFLDRSWLATPVIAISWALRGERFGDGHRRSLLLLAETLEINPVGPDCIIALNPSPEVLQRNAKRRRPPLLPPWCSVEGGVTEARIYRRIAAEVAGLWPVEIPGNPLEDEVTGIINKMVASPTVGLDLSALTCVLQKLADYDRPDLTEWVRACG